jgi:hypothetical protein
LSDPNYRALRFDELSVERNRGEEVAKAIKANGSEGSQTLGVFLPMIGVSTNVVSVITNWTGEPPKADYKDEKITGVRTRLFDTLARGQTPCTADGIYTHRWFMVAPDNVRMLTDTSVEAWKTMEADTDARIAGFWLDRQHNAKGEAVVLMIVYYPSLAAWDASRYWKPTPKGELQPNRNVWGSLFAQRRDILLDSWVSVHRLAK